MVAKNANTFMPSKDEIVMDINNGEILLCVKKDFLSFKHNNIIIKQPLSPDQGDYLLNNISNKVKQRCDQINEKISIELNQFMMS